MARDARPRGIVLLVVALLAVIILARAAVAIADSTSRDSGPVSTAEAERVMTQLVAAARSVSEDGTDYCRNWADSIGLCRESLDHAPRVRSGLLELPVSGPVVEYRVVRRSVVATAAGELSSGETYDSTTEFVRSSDGDVVAVDPVFWVDRDLVDSPGRSAVSSPRR